MANFNEEFLEKVFRESSEWFEGLDVVDKRGDTFLLEVNIGGSYNHFDCTEKTFRKDAKEFARKLKSELTHYSDEDEYYSLTHAIECFENIAKRKDIK